MDPRIPDQVCARASYTVFLFLNAENFPGERSPPVRRSLRYLAIKKATSKDSFQKKMTLLIYVYNERTE